MMVNQDVDDYRPTKTLHCRKILKKRKKQQPTENQKEW